MSRCFPKSGTTFYGNSGVLGLPSKGKNPEFDKATFSIYCPKLKEWVYDPDHEQMFDKIVDMCNAKVSYAHFLEDWEYAFSLAVAHYICTMDPVYVQAIGADTMSGGVMTSRSVGNLNYNYDAEKMMSENPAYKFWFQTGYGRQLVNLSLNRGWVGVLVIQ